MLWTYPARYRDRHGAEATAIQNDGRTLSMTVRGVTFSGEDFDAFAPAGGARDTDLSSFTLPRGYLCECEIECHIPMTVVVRGKNREGSLVVHLDLGSPAERGGIDRESLQLELRLSDSHWLSSGKSGLFETELLDIQRQMPEGIYLKACINCAFSDYSPCGQGLFGTLACFRDNKAGYRPVRSKSDLFRIWGTMTGFVQETDLCPEFERRETGTGYRG
jgi:hypothetical protein